MHRAVSGTAAIAAATIAFCAGILFGAALFALVEGLEWALLALIGAGSTATLAVLGLTSLPLIYLIWLFAAAVWRTEMTLRTPPEAEPTPPPAP